MSNRCQLISTLCCAVLLLCQPAMADRLKSRVLEYQLPQGDGTQHKAVQQIIRNSLDYIRDRLSASPTSSLDYLTEVGTYPSAGMAVGTPADIEALWNDAHEPALQVLYGEMRRSSDDELSITSTVFIGELPKWTGIALQDNRFSIQSSTKLTDYGRLADGHGYMLLYALILEALQSGKPPDALLALINESHTVYDKLASAALVTTDIDQIHQSINDIRAGIAP
jgi:hypothetical protein